MAVKLFHSGMELFSRFRLGIESEIVFADHCHDMIIVYKDGIRFTAHALLIVYPTNRDDWIEADSIRFYTWENVLSFQNVRGSRVLAEFGQAQIRRWLASLPSLNYRPPFAHIRKGNLVFFFEGVPRSVRSVGGKRRLRKWVQEVSPTVKKCYPSPFDGPIEMMIDVFTSSPAELPDVDRLSTSLMDAFQDLVYENDKQVRHLRPRVFESCSAFKQLECRSEPMEHFELSGIPPASVYPLAMGLTDYYVVRIYPT